MLFLGVLADGIPGQIINTWTGLPTATAIQTLWFLIVMKEGVCPSLAWWKLKLV
jgi:hypothetical protein